MTAIVIESQRLHLRPICSRDLEDIHRLLSLPETDQYNTLGIPNDFEQTKAMAAGWIEQMQGEEPSTHTLAILRKSDQAFIGLFGINVRLGKYQSAELWYKLHLDHWGKGYTTEASRRVIGFCFEDLNLHRIEAGAAVGNLGSIRVMEKCGMTCEGHKRQNLPLKTGFSDSKIYAILRSDFKDMTS